MSDAFTLPEYPGYQFHADLTASLTGCTIWEVVVVTAETDSWGHPALVGTKNGVIIEPRSKISEDREAAARKAAEALNLTRQRRET